MEAQEKKKVEMIAHEPVEASYDDRNELIDITYGPTPRDYVTEKLPKVEAFQKLYDYYYGNSSTTVPRNLPSGAANIGENTKINNATVYVKMRFKDNGTGQMMTTVKDLPLWIAVERAVTHRSHVELISKAEHDAFYQQRDKEQNEWRVQLAAENRRLNELAGNPIPVEPQRSRIQVIEQK